MPSLLAEVLASPGDNGPRERYAAKLGGNRGEYIALSLLKKPSRVERARIKELLSVHRQEWSRPLGINLSGQRWARGFVVRAHASTSATEENLAHPEWGLVEEIPCNSQLPPPDLMNALVSLGTFGSGPWLTRRRTPWPSLKRILARVDEAKLIVSDLERFPALDQAELYVDEDEFATESVSALAMHMRSLVLTGPAPTGGFKTVIERLADTAVEVLAYAPNQHLNGGIELTRGEDGTFCELRELPRTNAAAFRRWLSALPYGTLSRVKSKLPPAEYEPWMRTGR